MMLRAIACLALRGCSAIMMPNPPVMWFGPEPPPCRTSRWIPAADAVITLALIGALIQDYRVHKDEPPPSDLVGPTLPMVFVPTAGAFGISSLLGFIRANDCRVVTESWNKQRATTL